MLIQLLLAVLATVAASLGVCQPLSEPPEDVRVLGVESSARHPE